MPFHYFAEFLGPTTSWRARELEDSCVPSSKFSIASLLLFFLFVVSSPTYYIFVLRKLWLDISCILFFAFVAHHLFKFAALFFCSPPNRLCQRWWILCSGCRGSVERLSGFICSQFVSGCLLRRRIVLSKPTMPIFVDPWKDVSFPLSSCTSVEIF